MRDDGILYQADIDAILKRCKKEDLPEPKLVPFKWIKKQGREKVGKRNRYFTL